jgi:paraquat-inducible protein A
VTFIGVERSAASSARGAARLIGPGLVLSLALVPLTWWLPLFEARVPFLWRQQVSIASGLAELWRLDPLLCAVVFLFSVLAPLAKAAALVAVWYQAPLANARRQLDRLAILGKLAMTEVFLLAVIIVGIKGVGIGTVEIACGLHTFVVIVVLSLGVSTWAWAALGRAVTESPAIRPWRRRATEKP